MGFCWLMAPRLMLSASPLNRNPWPAIPVSVAELALVSVSVPLWWFLVESLKFPVCVLQGSLRWLTVM